MELVKNLEILIFYQNFGPMGLSINLQKQFKVHPYGRHSDQQRIKPI